MVTREEIIAEILKVPEKRLDELYKVIKNHEVPAEKDETDQNVMASLRETQISAPHDFSVRAQPFAEATQ